MIIFNTVDAIRDYLDQFKRQRVGFVPTLGALHEGHMSLIELSKSNSEITVCSIYLNPTQFNEAEDLKKYPRTLSEDIYKLERAGCDILFYPSDREIYPEGTDYELDVDLSDYMHVLEGDFRPGHFEGMAQVVHRLLDIVSPDQLYMGQKDYQQYLIVHKMVERLDWDVEVIAAPIVREEDGLAMSSRNMRLKDEIRERANVIFLTLENVKSKVDKNTDLDYLEDWALEQLRIPDFQPEYFKIVNAMNLKDVSNWEEADAIIACTAVWAGNVRLIDNMFLKKE